MTINANQAKAQVMGMIRALEKLPTKERESRPSSTFARNYNSLLELSKESMPAVDNRRWPPSVEETVCNARYTEIHAFLEQASAILSEGYNYSL
jgi:hypothetical protein